MVFVCSYNPSQASSFSSPVLGRDPQLAPLAYLCTWVNTYTVRIHCIYTILCPLVVFVGLLDTHLPMVINTIKPIYVCIYIYINPSENCSHKAS